MNLLIIGAGGHGRVASEIARACGYIKIAFVDDNSSHAIGKISDIEKYIGEFEEAFVGIGNNKFRCELMRRLEEAGYQIPTLVHPSAYVSQSAKIEKGTVVEPKAIINANSYIGEGCIISIGAIIDHDVSIEQYSHINSGAIVKAGAKIEPYTKLEVGEVILG